MNLRVITAGTMLMAALANPAAADDDDDEKRTRSSKNVPELKLGVKGDQFAVIARARFDGTR